MDLSKAFDRLLRDNLIAKLKVYGFDTKALNIFKSYLNKRKKFVNIIGTLSNTLEILTVVPQGSILGSIMFNIFINNLTILHIKNTNTHITTQMTLPSQYTVIQLLKLQNL